MIEMDDWDPEKLEAEWNKSHRPPLPDWFSDGIGIIFFVNENFLGNLKVSKFQHEFMKSSFLPKYEQKNVRISALCIEGRNSDNFLFIFLE